MYKKIFNKMLNEKKIKQYKLFCLNNAGGNKLLFNDFNKYLDKNINMISLEYSGRGTRFKEPLYLNMEQALEDLYRVISNKLDNNSNFCFLGYSMGSLLAYELTCLIRERLCLDPIHMFFAARFPPHINKYIVNFDKYTEEEIKSILLTYGTECLEIFKHKEAKRIFLPIITSDFLIVNNYVPRKKIFPYYCDITIMIGKNDIHMINEEIKEWNRYTTAKCRIIEYDGDHFFIKKNYKNIADEINSILRNEN